MKKALATRHMALKKLCVGKRRVLDNGAWCLNPKARGMVEFQNYSIPIPVHHVAASVRIVEELSAMIEKENIRSINDFGAGVGQYKAALLDKFPSLEYHAYDGAGNIVAHTQGFLDFFDLTMPLALPKADWIISLEVGEHIPSKYEGMFVRNLHRHNCRGVLMSWADLGQSGLYHMNDHSSQYIVGIFESLGYVYDRNGTDRFRNPSQNYYWFVNTTLLFRRKQPVC